MVALVAVEGPPCLLGLSPAGEARVAQALAPPAPRGPAVRSRPQPSSH